MASYYGNITVGTFAVQVLTLYSGAAIIVNNGTATVYMGLDRNVTTANGIPVSPGGTFSVSAQGASTIFAISGSPGQDVRWMQGLY